MMDAKERRRGGKLSNTSAITEPTLEVFGQRYKNIKEVIAYIDLIQAELAKPNLFQETRVFTSSEIELVKLRRSLESYVSHHFKIVCGVDDLGRVEENINQALNAELKRVSGVCCETTGDNTSSNLYCLAIDCDDCYYTIARPEITLREFIDQQTREVLWEKVCLDNQDKDPTKRDVVYSYRPTYVLQEILGAIVRELVFFAERRIGFKVSMQNVLLDDGGPNCARRVMLRNVFVLQDDAEFKATDVFKSVTDLVKLVALSHTPDVDAHLDGDWKHLSRMMCGSCSVTEMAIFCSHTFFWEPLEKIEFLAKLLLMERESSWDLASLDSLFEHYVDTMKQSNGSCVPGEKYFYWTDMLPRHPALVTRYEYATKVPNKMGMQSFYRPDLKGFLHFCLEVKENMNEGSMVGRWSYRDREVVIDFVFPEVVAELYCYGLMKLENGLAKLGWKK